MNRVRIRSLKVAAVICLIGSGALAAEESKPDSTGSPLRYTFSWSLAGNALQPRGGTTTGAPVTLDREPSPAWQALQVPGLSAQERDRRAILAMAGTYRVTFDFLEIVPFGPANREQSKQRAPYQSWGTEKVYVEEAQGTSISLVHILEMRIVQQDGSISEPMVTKHWRQDWQYEPTHIVEYQGRDQWRRRKLSASERKSAWSQTVYQVDESPRYASVGRFQHSSSFSSWLSADTWRPLPRREWSVRDDYHVLIGTNRHTMTATGWVQEENNLKGVLTSSRELDNSSPYVAREYGVARYERTRDADFAAADHYYQSTKKFWDQVRDEWSEAFTKDATIALRGAVDKLELFRPLFERADEIEQGGQTADGSRDLIRNTVNGMRAR